MNSFVFFFFFLYPFVLILVVVLLLFGGKKIPELIIRLGSGIKEFKDASKGGEEEASKSKDSIDNVLEDK